MTVTRLDGNIENELYISSSLSPSLETLKEISDNNHINFISDEMKFEMKSVNGALTNPMPTIRQNLRKNDQPSTLNGTNLQISSTSSAYNRTRDSIDLVRSTRAELPLFQSNSVVADSTSNNAVKSVLPARTLVRRQRRMQLQDAEIREDPVVKLNRLRARISGALSEVKGVLKQYSIDAEDGNIGEKYTSQELCNNIESSKTMNGRDGPINFRFLRRVRRKITFDDNNRENNKEQYDGNTQEKYLPDIDNFLTLNQPSLTNVNENILNAELSPFKDNPSNAITETQKNKEKFYDSSLNIIISNIKNNQNNILINSVHYKEILTPKSLIHSNNNITNYKENSKLITSQLNDDNTNHMLINSANLTNAKCSLHEENQNIQIDKNVTIRSSNDLKHVILNSAQKPSLKNSINFTNVDSSKLSLDYQNNKDISLMPSSNALLNVSPKKRLSLKSKEASREVSIAAAEGTRIQSSTIPQIAINMKTKKRPSDSDAILKRKVLTKMKPSDIKIDKKAQLKCKLITKVKRPYMKTEHIEMQTSKQQTTAILGELTDGVANNRIVDAPTAVSSTVIAITITTERNNMVVGAERLPTTSTQKLMPTKLVFDNLSESIKNSEELISNTKSGNEEFSSSTKSGVQNNSLVSTIEGPLRETDSNNQTQLTKLVSTTPQTVSELYETDNLHKNENIKIPTALTTESENYSTVGTKKFPLPLTSERSDELKTFSDILLVSESVSISSAAPTISPISHVPELALLPFSLTADADLSVTSEEIKEPINKHNIPDDSLQIKSEVHKTQQVPTIADNIFTDAVAIVAASSVKALASQSEKNKLSNIGEPRHQITDELCIGNTKPSLTLIVIDSSAHTIKSETSQSQKQPKMPEFQVGPTPVKTVDVLLEDNSSQPFNILKDDFIKNKLSSKKILRKSSTDKAPTFKYIGITSISNFKDICPEKIKDKEKIKLNFDSSLSEPINKELPEILNIDSRIEPTTLVKGTENINLIVEQNQKVNKSRKVKKKVIIKRQQRRLSVTDTFFKESEDSIANETNEPEFETLEKPIEYVTDEEDAQTGNANDTEQKELSKPLKGCLKQREFQVGDWVMYAERFKKTQVRWKKGQVIERITCISYKVDIDGIEVPAHISYIKKYTDRKVNFGGKEYLQIDYEQIAEEEKKIRTYSIWNMV